MSPLALAPSAHHASVHHGASGPISALPSRAVEWLLLCALFILLFGPKLFGISALDTLSVGCAAVATARVILRGPIAFGPVDRIVLGLLAILLLDACVVYLIAAIRQPTAETFYPQKFLRAILNYVAAVSLVHFYRERYDSYVLPAILRDVALACSAHALIMIVQFVHPDANRVILAISGNTNPSGIRVTGLTISYNVLGVTQGAGMIAALDLLFGRRLRDRTSTAMLLGGCAVTCMLSLMLAGRLSAYLMLGFAGLVILSHGKEKSTWRLLGMATLSAMIIVVLTLLAAGPAAQKFVYFTLMHLLEPIDSYLRTGQLVAASLQTVTERMYFWPADQIDLLIGTSLSGRGAVYIPSDVGLVLSIFGIGIIGTAMMYLFYLINALVLFRYRHRYRGAILTFGAVLLSILALNLKEQSFLTRHSFTLTAISLALAALPRNPEMRLRRGDAH